MPHSVRNQRPACAARVAHRLGSPAAACPSCSAATTIVAPLVFLLAVLSGSSGPLPAEDKRQAANPAASLVLVDNGQPRCVIVTGNQPNAQQQRAAAELQSHLQLMSGAQIAIVTEQQLTPQSPPVKVLVGASRLAKQNGVDAARLAPESFVIRTGPDLLLLVGEDGGGKNNPRSGTLWAVYDLLQDDLGCRWIWPGEIGRVVPERKTIAIPALSREEGPTVAVRVFRTSNQDKHRETYRKEKLDRWLDLGATYDQLAEDERVWLQRMRMGRSFPLSYGHAFTDWWEKFGRSEPELFAMQANGQRGPAKKKQPDFVKMCVSSPRLWDKQLQSIQERAKAGGKGMWLNACENDGSAGFCLCERCRAWDRPDKSSAAAGKSAATKSAATKSSTGDANPKLPAVPDGSEVDAADDAGRKPSATDANPLPASLSNRYARWYNELARRMKQVDPEGRVIAYAYSRYRSPPEGLDRLEKNLWVGYIGFNAYPRSAEMAAQSQSEWQGWSDRGATVFLRSNSLFYLGEGLPLVVTKQLAEDTRFQIQHGLTVTDYDCLQGSWATTGPGYYLLARMLWDGQADPAQLEQEFYAAFGPLAPAVKQYFDDWEQFTTELGQNAEFMRLNRTERMQATARFYPAARFEAAAKTLALAEPLKKKATPAELERFRNIELGLEHGRLLWAALQDGKVSNGPEGERLMKFRKQHAGRNVVNPYWTTSKEMRYRVWE